MSAEGWRPVVGHEGRYEVSDLGHVRSLDRITPQHGHRRRGRTLAGSPNQSGHLQVGLWVGPRRHQALIHRLVLMAFVGPPPDGMEACHNDGNPTNNSLENLRWDTRSANRYDSVRHGTHYQANKTHCPQGHPYDEENTYVVVSRGIRQCRRCKQERSRAAHAARRQRLEEAMK